MPRGIPERLDERGVAESIRRNAGQWQPPEADRKEPMKKEGGPENRHGVQRRRREPTRAVPTAVRFPGAENPEGNRYSQHCQQGERVQPERDGKPLPQDRRDRLLLGERRPEVPTKDVAHPKSVPGGPRLVEVVL